MDKVLNWTAPEWEVARAFFCMETTVDWSLTWLQQAKNVQNHWFKQHSEDPSKDYIAHRLRYQCRPMDFQWVAMLFADTQQQLMDSNNWFPRKA
jgi:hypothetical protein